MPLVTALHAWLAMVPAIALAPDTRLEIVVIDGRLDVIEMKKPKKVGKVPTSELYLLNLARYCPLHKNCPSWLNGLIL